MDARLPDGSIYHGDGHLSGRRFGDAHWRRSSRSRGGRESGRAAGPNGSSGAAIRSAAAQPAAMVTDTGMGMRTKVGLPAPAMSGAMLAANAAKQVLASELCQGDAGRHRGGQQVRGRGVPERAAGLQEPEADPAGADQQLLLRPGHGVGDARSDGQDRRPAEDRKGAGDE